MDEDHLVALAVAEEVVHLLVRAAERDLDVLVPHQQAPAADRVALGLEAHRREVPVLVAVRDPLVALDRLELVHLRHPAGRGQVVEDRLVPREALEAHHLFGQQRPVVAELDVPLARNVAESLVEGHGGRIVRRRFDREVGEPLADRRRELEAVAGARRADDDAAAPFEDEALVCRGRVHARLRPRRLGLGQPVGVVRPGGDALDQLRVRLARHVRVGLLPGVVRTDLEPVDSGRRASTCRACAGRAGTRRPTEPAGRRRPAGSSRTSRASS